MSYFRRRTPADLERAKRLERQVDQQIVLLTPIPDTDTDEKESP